MADRRDIIDHKRIRTITNSFSWVDHRLITGGFLDDLSTYAILLYFFLIAVSDRHGVSFYHDDRICLLLKIDLRCLGEAREDLMNRGLLVYRYPVYQVVALPEKPVQPPTAEELAEEKRKKDRGYLARFKEALRC
ncbi:MAG: hypothetical protein JW682_08860 [Campylobacterales bacterium]|nr:hypothetical protein [Campylobacterales bacterium]